MGDDVLKEFIQRDIFVRAGRGALRLVDEFLRLRLSLDQSAEPGTEEELPYDNDVRIEQVYVDDSDDDSFEDHFESESDEWTDL